MSALATLSPAKLDQLAHEINREHRACELAHGEAVAHAVRCGQLLTEAKDGVRHGQWLIWLAENFSDSERTAQLYMQFAEDPQRVADFGSVREAAKAIATPREQPDPDPDREPVDVGAQLRGLGLDTAAARQELERRPEPSRSAVERRALREINDARSAMERHLRQVERSDLGGWARAEAAGRAAASARETGELLDGLAEALR